MFCKNCGNKIEDNSNYCMKCGASINNAGTPQVQQPVFEEKNKDGKTTVIILAIIGGLILSGIIAIVVFFFFSNVLWGSIQESVNNQWSNISTGESSNSEWSNITTKETTNDSSLDIKAIQEALPKTNEVHVYVFRGEGCPHCEEALEWFKSIEEEYGTKFEVIDYETWYNKDNDELKQRVADARGEEAEGVPYIIIGNKSWNGFTESYETDMLSKINSEFETEVKDRYDIIKLLSALEK